MASSLRRPWQCLLALVVFSCVPRSGTDVGNGLTIKVNMQGYEVSPPSVTRSLKLASGVTIDGFWTTTSRLRLIASQDCASDGGIDLPGPLVADVVGQGFLGRPPEISKTTNRFCALRIDFDKLDANMLPAAAPPELAGLSVLLQGHRADGTPFVVRSTMTGSYRLEALNDSFTLPGHDPSIIIGVEMSAPVAALQLDTLSGNPIQIDDSTNTNRLKDFEAALKDAGSLFNDLDDDGQLSPNETSPANELGYGHS